MRIKKFITSFTSIEASNLVANFTKDRNLNLV